MLDRPLLHDHPDAGDCRQPRPQEARAAVAGHVPGDDAAVLGAARRRHRHRRRADVLPGAQPRPDRRAPADGARARCSDDSTHAQRKVASRSGIRRSSAARSSTRSRKLHPRTMAKNPVMFVVEVGSVLTTVRFALGRRGGPAGPRLRAADHVLALAHRALRQLRRGDGRGARQGAGRHAAQGADRDRRESSCCPAARPRRCRRPRCARTTW